MTEFDLSRLGWDERLTHEFETIAAPGLEPGRVAVEHRDAYVVYAASGERWAELSGRFRHAVLLRGDLPAVGDWVAVRLPDGEGPALIEAVLPRRSTFSRKEAWERVEEQVLAANLDVLLVVTSLTSELNPRRIERFLASAWEAGSVPAVVLNKADLGDPAAALERIALAAPGVEVFVTSAHTGEGVEAIAARLAGGLTAALVGSSGVGKSSLVNRLLGVDALDVSATRSDDRGRHTTSRRELFLVPAGGVIIDTPGLRELQLWETDGVEDTYAEVAELAAACRFRDCRHEREPGCAVRLAMDEGRLDPGRFAGYVKLRREAAFIALKRDRRLELANRRKWKAIKKETRRRART